MYEIGIEVVFLAVLILINGLFSMTEIAVVSARRVRLARSAQDGNAGAAKALDLQDNPDTFLSTVQIGITLVGVLSGAFGGALLSDEVASVVAQVPMLETYSSQIGFGVIILIITYFSLVVGELVPKNIALNRPEMIASMFSRPMNLVSKITAPAVWLLSLSTRLILKVFRIHEATEATITEEEIRAHIAHGTETGVLERTEQELIESIIRLDDRRVPSVMTPRTKIQWLNLDDDLAVNKQKLIESHYSRMPIARGTLDKMIGVVKASDVLSQVLSGAEMDLESVVRQPVFVPETKTALELLETFRESHTLLAMVIDEYGAVEGLVTMNDLLEEIVGDLPAAGQVRRQFVVREDGSFLLDGELAVIDLVDLLNLASLPKDESGSYQTLGGFVLARLERIPTEGDKFKWDGHTFEIMDMDGRRIDKVLVTKD